MGDKTKAKICHNSLVLIGFEYVEHTPLGFFDFNDETDKTTFLKGKYENFQADGKLVVKNNGFTPIKNAEGSFTAPELCVVSRAKTRPVLIFQDMEFCEEHHDNVFVIPIQTLRKPEESKYNKTPGGKAKYKDDLLYYNNVVSKSEKVYDHYYFPKTADDGSLYERVLVLSDARFVHNSMVIKQIPESGLNQDDIKEISIRLSKMLNIKDIEYCKKCHYVDMYDNFTKIMKRIERLKKEA